MKRLISELWPAASSDLLLPTELTSGTLVQYALQPTLRTVYDELLNSASGREIFMRPVDAYMGAGTGGGTEEMSFEELSRAARARGEVLMGVQRAEKKLPELNPSKRAKVRRSDQLVLLGEAF